MQLADEKCSDGRNAPPVKVLHARELLKELGQDHLHLNAILSWEKRSLARQCDEAFSKL